MNEEFKKALEDTLAEWGVKDEDKKEFIADLGKRLEASDDEPVKDEIEEAKENIEEKGEDTQTEKDRVDESVGEQMKDEGKEDEQSAKDRVDESEGEEKAEEEKEEKTEEQPPEEPAEEKKEEPKEDPKQEQPNKFDLLAGKIDQLIGSVTQLVSSMSNNADPDAQALEGAKARYGVNPGVFQDDGKENGKEITDGREAKAVFRTQR